MNEDFRRDLYLYLTGAALSALLTALAFWTVLGMALERAPTLFVLAVCAVGQIMVQLRCFLHIRSEGQTREDLQLILFSLMLMGIMVAGTIWIMGNLDTRMH